MNRTLTDLRKSHEGHIYLSFHSQQEYDAFLTRAENEDFRFGEHLPTEHIGEPWDIISLLEENRLAFCGTFSHMAYANNEANVHRVDYFKFISSKENYTF